MENSPQRKLPRMIYVLTAAFEQRDLVFVFFVDTVFVKQVMNLFIQSTPSQQVRIYFSQKSPGRCMYRHRIEMFGFVILQ
jgi:hypothetical protein